MSLTTARLGLYKYQTTDTADLTANNGNADTLDAASIAVAHTLAQNVASTGQVTITTFSVTVTGLYMAMVYVDLSNGTSGNKIGCGCNWTDPNTSTAEFTNFTLSNAGTSQMATGANTFANGRWASFPVFVYAKAGTNLFVNYQDPTNMPNDFVSAAIVRVW